MSHEVDTKKLVNILRNKVSDLDFENIKLRLLMEEYITQNKSLEAQVSQLYKKIEELSRDNIGETPMT